MEQEKNLENWLNYFNSKLGVDITERTRIQKRVFARMLFAKKMDELNFHYTNVSTILKIHRTTHIHYMNSYNYVKKHPDFVEIAEKLDFFHIKTFDYNEVKEIFVTLLKNQEDALFDGRYTFSGVRSTKIKEVFAKRGLKIDF